MKIPKTPISYKLDLSNTRQREIGVEMNIDLPGPLDVVMPHISPGSPTNSLNHDRRIRNVRVSDAEGQRIPHQRLKEGGFRVDARGPVTVHYTVNADEFSHVRANLTEDHAYVNGPAAMMYVKGRETDTPSTIEMVNVPNPEWDAVASLPKLKDVPHAFWASCYQDVADTNIFLGEVESASEVVGDTQLTVNVHGTPPWTNLRVNGATAEESLQDLTALWRVFSANFGEFPLERLHGSTPRPEGVEQHDKYVVTKHYFHNGPRTAGGYEHYHGHELLLHKASEEGIEKKYDSDGRAYERGTLGHELVHKLLAKYVTHDGIDLEDLSSVEKTDGLWVTEGVTDWTGVVLERQARLMSEPEYLGHLEGFYQRYLTDISYDMSSPTDDSLDAHIGNSNYYNKGAVAGSLLDLEMRHYSGGERGMFDVLRALKDEFGGSGRGHTLDDMERLCLQQVKDSPEGQRRITEFFDKHMRDRQPLDIEGALAHVGYRLQEALEEADPEFIDLFSETEGLQVRADGHLGLVKCSHEHGHDHEHEKKDKKAFLPTLGLQLKQGSKGWKIGGVRRDSAAGEAGLAAFSGEYIKEPAYDEEKRQLSFSVQAEDMFTGLTETHHFVLDEKPATVMKLVAVDEPTPEQLALREQWLTGFWN